LRICELINYFQGVDELNQIGGSKSENKCNQNNTVYCNGLILGIRGKDGSNLWKIYTKSEVFEINCNSIDINMVNFSNFILKEMLPLVS